MGCWDVFCPMCGLSLQGLYYMEDLIMNYSEKYPEKYNTKTKKYEIQDLIMEKDNLFIKHKLLNKIQWLSKCTILLPNQKAKHGFEETGCNVDFYNQKTKESYTITEFDFDGSIGVVLHTDCWKYFKKITKQELKFDDFDLKRIHKEGVWFQYKFKYLNYKEVEKYHDQMFNLDKLYFNPKDFYIVYSPLNNDENSKKNAKRISINILKVLKNKPKMRPSPIQSATIYPNGTIQQGNDGCNYIIKYDKNKNKKWVKITEETKLSFEKDLKNKLYKWWLELSKGGILAIYSNNKYKLISGTVNKISKEWIKLNDDKEVKAIIWSSISIDILESFIKFLVKKNNDEFLKKLLKLTTTNIVKYLIENYKTYFYKMKLKSNKDYTLKTIKYVKPISKKRKSKKELK